MDRLLSLSQAARMVGVTRRVLQQQIQNGRLSTFEGNIRMSALLKEYPDAQQHADSSGMLEKVRRIREAALAKGPADARPDPDRLLAENQRLKVDLSMLQDQVAGYERLAAETSDRLLELQEKCDQRQAMVLGTFIGWFMHQVKLRDNS